MPPPKYTPSLTWVQPKKQLGQHFLNDQNIAHKIVGSLEATRSASVVEVGPGTGALTGMLLERFGSKFYALEIDRESVAFLRMKLPALGANLIQEDALTFNYHSLPRGGISIIGNFPYNISSQIFFKVLENREQVDEVVGMLQREVALRICEPPGSRTYGILSVLLQAFYHITYLFTVNEGVFTPPPKVKSAVIRLARNHVQTLPCNEELFVRVVKAGFNQRRKTLRNAIRSGFPGFKGNSDLLDKRAEQLGVSEFVELTNLVEQVN